MWVNKNNPTSSATPPTTITVSFKEDEFNIQNNTYSLKEWLIINNNNTYVLDNLKLWVPSFKGEQNVTINYAKFNQIYFGPYPAQGYIEVSNLYDRNITLDVLFNGNGIQTYGTSKNYTISAYPDSIPTEVKYNAGPYRGVLTYLAKKYSTVNKGDMIYNTNTVDIAKWDNDIAGTVDAINSRLSVGTQLLANEYVATVIYYNDLIPEIKKNIII